MIMLLVSLVAFYLFIGAIIVLGKAAFHPEAGANIVNEYHTNGFVAIAVMLFITIVAWPMVFNK